MIGELALVVIVIWQVALAAISNCEVTVKVLPAQVIVTRTAPLAPTCHVPGPRRGTVASGNVALSCPLTALFEADTAGTVALGAPLDSVELLELTAPPAVVEVGGASVVVVLLGVETVVGARAGRLARGVSLDRGGRWKSSSRWK